MVFKLFSRFAVTSGAVLAALLLGGYATAQEPPVPDTYKAVTTNMTPSGVELKADILRWSDEAERRAVIEALAAEDASAALARLPSVGVVWRSGSAVGNSIKYAHRSERADGGERVVLVTDKRLGATSFNPWTAGDSTSASPPDYSVIEFHRPDEGAGEGTLSLAANVEIDAEAATVMLATDPAAGMLLTEVRLEPKPYWARQD